MGVTQRAKLWPPRFDLGRLRNRLQLQKPQQNTGTRCKHAPGTKENPLDTQGVNAKARDLIAPVLGAQRTDALIQRVNALEDVKSVRDLRSLLTGARTR